MKMNVNVVMEMEYIIEADVPYEKEEKLFEELSCASCMGDILDVEMFLAERGLRYNATWAGKNFRIETRR